jgi:hypothetical protein
MITSDVVGLAEIDSRLGLAVGTSRQWVRRHGPDTRSRTPFPRPHWQVSAEDGYDWAEVRRWLADTGRLVRTTALDEHGVYRMRETAEPDQPEALGGQIRAALAGVPRSRWVLENEDGRWLLWLAGADTRAGHQESWAQRHRPGDGDSQTYATSRWGGDYRLALRVDELLRQAGLSIPLPDPPVPLADGERVEVRV